MTFSPPILRNLITSQISRSRAKTGRASAGLLDVWWGCGCGGPAYYVAPTYVAPPFIEPIPAVIYPQVQVVVAPPPVVYAPAPVYYDDYYGPRQCQEFQRDEYRHGRVYRSYYTACRAPDGRWYPQ